MLGKDASLIPLIDPKDTGCGTEDVFGSYSDHAFYKLMHFAIALSAITFMKPLYYLKSINLQVGAAAFTIGMFGVVVLHLRNRSRLSRSMILIASLWILAMVWKLLPIRTNLQLGFNFIDIFLLVFFILLPDREKRAVLHQVSKIACVVSVFSIVIVVLLAMGIDLPYYNMHLSFRHQSLHLYPGTAVLSSQYFKIGTGGVLVRSSGFFVEPGHYGVFCGIILAAGGFSLKGMKNKLILLGGISTFSGAFFLLLALGILFKVFHNALTFSREAIGILFSVIFVLGMLVIGFRQTPEQFQNRVLWDRFSGMSSYKELEGSRADHDFNVRFDEYRTTPKSLVGEGAGDIGASDWRGLVMKYGWFMIPYYFFIYLCMVLVSSVTWNVKFSLLIAILTISIHRIAYIDNFLIVVVFSSGLTAEA